MIYSPNKVLYGNFKMYEVARSSTAARLDIDNTPSDDVLECAEMVAKHILQPVRDQFGSFTPSSWFRCEELEKVLTKKSFQHWCNKHAMNASDTMAWHAYLTLKSHPKGEAVDFEVVGVDNNLLYKWCKENLPMYDQLIEEYTKFSDPSAGWVHASYSTKQNRKQILKIG